MHFNPISVKAVCLIINERKELLVSEDLDTVKNKKFCVPLGGHIRFNELSSDTIKREFKEEINAELINITLLTVLENRYTWNGTDCHEINFVYRGELADKALYNNNNIPFLDTKYPNAKIKWIRVDDFKSGEHILYPEELFKRIDSHIGSYLYPEKSIS